MITRARIVTIDGPAGAGKSTVSREVARQLGCVYLDTGAMYRAVAWMAIRNNADISNEPHVRNLINGLDIRLTDVKVEVNGYDVSSEIRTPEIDKAASLISAWSCVRQYLTALQKDMGKRQDIVAEGRDMGTVVFPYARHKFFLTASVEVRAQRRTAQLKEMGKEAVYEEVLEQIMSRDARDEARDISPMQPAEDAIILDTSKMTTEDVIASIVSRVILGHYA